MHPNNGWPTEAHAKAPDFLRPIVTNAKYLVRCAVCGFAHDSGALDEAGALADVAARHDPAHTEYTATAY